MEWLFRGYFILSLGLIPFVFYIGYIVGIKVGHKINEDKWMKIMKGDTKNL